MVKNKGNIFVITAPSGAGKSSLVQKVCAEHPNIQVSVSHTTREKRKGEIEGVNYFFINKTQFEQMLANNEFLEYALVYDHYYGTNINTINQLLATGKDIILEIDWQGAKQIKQLMPDTVLIYILPPSIAELEKRLTTRATDSHDTIKYRMSLAVEDMSHAPDFDYVIINDNFNIAAQDLYSIIRVQGFKNK